MKRRSYWLKIDNAGKIFPAVSNEKRPSTFRVSMYLKEDIDHEVLEKAVNETLIKFETYAVSIKSGFFWAYLVDNNSYFKVEEESGYICQYIKRGKNDYQFRVTYFKNRINLEVFHVLSDGNSAIEFLKSIVYKYLKLKDIVFEHEGKIISESNMTLSRSSDTFNIEYDSKKKKSLKEENAYQLNGARQEDNFYLFVKASLKTSDLLTLTRDNGATITQYASALLMYSIYMTQPTAKKSNDAIKMFIPVNLRKYFASNTLRNFSLYIKTSFKPNLKEYTFEEILEIVKEDFKKELNKEELFKRMNANVGFEKNILVRFLPLFLKNIVFRIGYKFLAQKISTCSISNLGLIDLPSEMYKYVLDVDFAFSGEGLNMTLASINERTNIMFTTSLIDLGIMEFFIEHLNKKNIEITLSSNIGGTDDEKM